MQHPWTLSHVGRLHTKHGNTCTHTHDLQLMGAEMPIGYEIALCSARPPARVSLACSTCRAYVFPYPPSRVI
eukprot:6179280-Pleurochrysis_carterae.AAC.4